MEVIGGLMNLGSSIRAGTAVRTHYMTYKYISATRLKILSQRHTSLK